MPPSPENSGDAPRPEIPDYELLRVIGRGGYGDVWLARGLTGLYRAVKVLWRDRYPDSAPFEREFQGLSRFSAVASARAGQLALLHVGRNEAAGFFYYVMELADDAERGRQIDPARYTPLTLREVRLRRGRIPADECVRYGIALSVDLAALHRCGLVHRDIKPSNVILVDGRPKLADIGLVAEASQALTYVGTEGYVPPEGPGRPSADVFALGNLLYELATGLERSEFPRLPANLGELPDRRRLVELNEIILKAAERNPARRLSDADALLLALGKLSHRGMDRSRLGRAVAIALVIGIAAASFPLWQWQRARGDATKAPAAAVTLPRLAVVETKSIAVLPFENLSDDKENAFFADGVHEDILSNLTNIRALKVISRTSVRQYRGTTKTVKQIGAELGVAYILEGTVRRSGNQVRVTGQLIDARRDEHVWAQTFDGELTDIFALQGRLAQAIATQLRTVLSPEEQKLVEARPTSSPEAYDLYLQARALLRSGGNLSADKLRRCEQLLQESVAQDPRFALAWARLSSVHVGLFFNQVDRSPARLALAKAAGERARELAPASSEVEVCLGEFAVYGLEDYPQARAHFERAVQLNPGDGDAQMSLGLILRRIGHWKEAVGHLRVGRDVDPRNPRNLDILLTTLMVSAHWPEGLAALRDSLEFDSSNLQRQFGVLRLEAQVQGKSEPSMNDWAARLPAAERARPELHDLLVEWNWEHGDAAAVARLTESAPDGTQEPDLPSAGQRVWALAVLGRNDEARTQCQLVSVAAAKQLATDGEDRVAMDVQGMMRAFLGDRTSALARLLPRIEHYRQLGDDMNLAELEETRLAILAALDDRDAVFAGLRNLYRRPMGPDPRTFGTSLTWWRLHGDPRFEAIAHDPSILEPRF